MKTYLILAAALLTAFVWAGTSWAQFEGAVWDTLTWDNYKDVVCKEALCVTGNKILLAYSKGWHTPDWQWEWEVHYLVRDQVTGWSEDELVAPGYAPAIFASDVPFQAIALFFESGLDIYGAVIHSPEEAWTPVNLTNSAALDIYPTVAVDIARVVHCTWVNKADSVWKIAYGKLLADSLAIEIIEDSYLGDYGAGAMPFIVTVSGLPHIFYRGGDIYYGYRIWHSYREVLDGPWVTEVLATENGEDLRAYAAVGVNGDIHLSISGDMGPTSVSHVYYLCRDQQTGQWSTPMLVWANSSDGGSISLTGDGAIYIAISGVSGVIPTGDIYISRKADDHFDTEWVGNFELAIEPVITFLSGSEGAIVSQACIHGPEVTDYEIIYYGPTPSRIEENVPAPQIPLLYSSYPNPFNSRTVITVRGQLSSETTIDIFDSLGRKVRSLLPGASWHRRCDFVWDGLTDNGFGCPSGTYFYRVENGNTSSCGKATLLK